MHPIQDLGGSVGVTDERPFMTPDDASAIAFAINRYFGPEADDFVRRNIRYFELPPSNINAAAAWRQVLAALEALTGPPDERPQPLLPKV